MSLKLNTEEFVKKAKKVHGNKYNYSKVNYLNSKTKVIIICSIHGEFSQTPGKHLFGRGCLECSGKKKLNTKEFIEKSVLIHGNKYDYSKVNYVNSKTKVIIICPVHGEFEQMSNNHLAGHGCLECSGKEKLNTEEFVKKAKKVHGNKYDYSKVNYIGANNKIKIICPIHGEFEQISNSHLDGHGCLECSGKKKSNTEEFINKAIKVHGNKYDYLKVNYIGANNKIKIICPIHGEFKQIPSNHLYGKGCLECSGKKKSNKKEFINRAIRVHGNKYDYSKVNYKNIDTEVIITCPIHGEFKQIPSNHLYGKGCLECSGKKKSNTKEFIEKSVLIHGNKYDYSNVDYINAKNEVIIVCPIHGEFKQIPNKHLSGHGCLHCSHHISKSSQKWLDSFNNSNIIREKTIKIGKKIIRVDGYDPITKTIYEFNGDFWHGNLNKFNSNDINPVVKKTFGELYNLTIKKEKLIKDANYNLITIWESKFIKEQNG